MKSTMLTDKNITNGEKIVRILMDEGIKSILFIPYNKAMVDSMTSVIESAKNLGLKVEVYPLKFTTCGEERYEFETKGSKPNVEDFDAVVYHNPYDNVNYVTEVDKNFHSNKLKGKTTLVYIPYYCGKSSNLDFLVNPGCQNADIIFCDPEDEIGYKLIYSDYSDKKIFGIESPKMDTIVKGDGNCVLICTSLIAFLDGGKYKIAAYREWINKLENEEIIFRPHPLMRETIRTLRPNLLKDWDNLIDEIKSKNIEIDTEPQVGKTFAKCKLLVSDPSSIIKMWEKTSKPYNVIEMSYN